MISADMRLEPPERVRALGPPFELLALLPFPGGIRCIVLFDPLVEFAGQSADDLFVAGIGHAKAGRTQAAEVTCRLDHHHAVPHAGGLDGGGDAGAGSAVDDDVVCWLGGAGALTRGKQQQRK